MSSKSLAQWHKDRIALGRTDPEAARALAPPTPAAPRAVVEPVINLPVEDAFSELVGLIADDVSLEEHLRHQDQNEDD